MSQFDDLLRLQELDTAIDQLEFRRGALPQIAQLEELARQRAGVEATLSDVDAELARLSASEREAEDQASLCSDKADAVDASLYDGSVTSHKELESLQAELAQLRERQSQFEDTALELLEAAAAFEDQRASALAAIAEIDEQIGRVDQERIVAGAEVDAELDTVRNERGEAAAPVPADLLASYTALRAQLGGIAVARLVGSRCDGCHLQIPAVDLDTIRHTDADQMVHCPECQRILVR